MRSASSYPARASCYVNVANAQRVGVRSQYGPFRNHNAAQAFINQNDLSFRALYEHFRHRRCCRWFRSYLSDPRVQAAGQIGNALGQAIGDALRGDPNEAARQQAAAAQAADLEQQRLAEEARRQKKQEAYNRLVTHLKILDGGGGLGLKDLKTGDSQNDGGHIGIRGLPGLYSTTAVARGATSLMAFPVCRASTSTVPAENHPASRAEASIDDGRQQYTRPQPRRVAPSMGLQMTIATRQAMRLTALLMETPRNQAPAPAQLLPVSQNPNRQRVMAARRSQHSQLPQAGHPERHGDKPELGHLRNLCSNKLPPPRRRPSRQRWMMPLSKRGTVSTPPLGSGATKPVVMAAASVASAPSASRQVPASVATASSPASIRPTPPLQANAGQSAPPIGASTTASVPPPPNTSAAAAGVDSQNSGHPDTKTVSYPVGWDDVP